MTEGTIPPPPWPACWADGADELIVTDVADQERAVLLAVHEPPRMRRRPVPEAGRAPDQGVEATQEELLEHLVDGDCGEGTLLVPIIGAPGTGKSHLVAWINARIQQRPGLEVRYVPRDETSLRQVVEILFEGLEGPEFERFDAAKKRWTKEDKEDKERQGGDDGLSSEDSLERVGTRLLTRIGELLQFGLDGSWHSARDVDEETRVALCDQWVLPAFIKDPVVQDRLTRPGGAVYQLAKDIVEGSKHRSDDADELGFHTDDLLVKGLRGLGPYAAKALGYLELQPGFADAAARILTDALNEAAPAVMGLGGIQLAEAFKEFRQQLGPDRELLILFEDVAITYGLRGALADVLATAAKQKGEAPLCNMRVALAVTADYWAQMPETLTSRARAWGTSMFDLDVADGASRAPNLVGRYLNAARLGMDQLRNASWEDGEVPNACDTCPRRSPCHEAFGVSSAGHGMFPLTPHAARNLAGIADDHARPREVLSKVVRPVLKESPSLQRGAFPAGEAVHKLVETGLRTELLKRLSLQQTEALDASGLSDADRTRARTLLLAWGPPPLDRVMKLLGLPADLAPSDGTPVPITTTDTELPKSRDETPKQDEPRLAPEPYADVLAAWADDEPLLVEPSRTMRGLVWDHLREGIHWNDLARDQTAALEMLDILGRKQQQANLAVRLQNAAGGGGVGAAQGAPLVDLPATAASVRLLKAMVALREDGALSSNGGLEHLAMVRNFVEDVEDDVRRRIAATAAARAHLVDAGKLVVLAAAPLVRNLGIDGAPTFDTALGTLPDAAEPPAGAGREWVAAWRAATAEYKRATSVLTSATTRKQGTGTITAIDKAALDLRAIANDPGGLKRGLKGDGLSAAHDELAKAIAAGVKAEASALGATIAAIEAHIGEGEKLELDAIVEELKASFEAALKASVLAPADGVKRLEELQIPAPDTAETTLARARAAVKASADGLSLDGIARLARVDRSSLDDVAAYLDLAATVLAGSESVAREALGQQNDDDGAGQRAQSVVDGLLNVAADLQ